MIKKYIKFNEGIKSLLVGPTKEEVWKNLGYDKSFDNLEDFLTELCDGMDASIGYDGQSHSEIVFSKDGKELFEFDIKEKKLSVAYFAVQRIIYDMFYDGKEGNENEMREIIKKVISNELGNDDFEVDMF